MGENKDLLVASNYLYARAIFKVATNNEDKMPENERPCAIGSTETGDRG